MILLEGMHHISLGSANLARTAKFYCELFDFELIEEAEKYSLLHLGALHIRFNHIPSYESTIKNPGETSFAFVLDVDDFTEAIHELEEREIEIIKGPVPIESGESLLIADPDGHLIELFYQE